MPHTQQNAESSVAAPLGVLTFEGSPNSITTGNEVGQQTLCDEWGFFRNSTAQNPTHKPSEANNNSGGVIRSLELPFFRMLSKKE
jgi:hypothetical protein